MPTLQAFRDVEVATKTASRLIQQRAAFSPPSLSRSTLHNYWPLLTVERWRKAAA